MAPMSMSSARICSACECACMLEGLGPIAPLHVPINACISICMHKMSIFRPVALPLKTECRAGAEWRRRIRCHDMTKIRI